MQCSRYVFLFCAHHNAIMRICRHPTTTRRLFHANTHRRHLNGTRWRQRRDAEPYKSATCTHRAAPRVAVRVWFWLRCGVLDPAAAVLLPLHAPALTVERRSSRRSMHDAVPLIGPALQLSFVSSTPLPLLRALVPAHFGWSDKVRRQNLWARLITGFNNE